MKECWRWFGPLDAIALPEVAQTGASGIVTALHEVPYGEVWTRGAIAERQALITRTPGLNWEVVESLPIHERIRQGAGDLSGLFANYRQSLANLAAAGIRTVCYNFMPVLDWTRTDVASPLPGGGSTLRFEAAKMAALEIHMLERAGAAQDYGNDVCARAADWYVSSSESDREALLGAVMMGLPGAFDRYDIPGLRDMLAAYDGIGREELRGNLVRFLEEVIPAAEDLGIAMCIHPDDPPRDILGLPRIASSEEDLAAILGAVDSPANGLTLCSGSLGAGPGNDVVAITERFAGRIAFAHLRNVRKDPDGSFEEAAHLDGDTDMVALLRVLMAEDRRRRAEGASEIPFRPDHGHVLLDDEGRKTHPGYPLIGRMRGLAELRGVVRALESVE